MPFEMKGIFFGIIIEICFIYLQYQIHAMAKKYFYIIFFFLFLFSARVSAQESRPAANAKTQETTIEGLSFYPNPVSNGKIYITSKSTLDKEIAIYDVLGKKVLQSVVTSKELNVSSLSPGVYIIKIKEGEATATRKLIVK
jgi:hypothetical protein